MTREEIVNSMSLQDAIQVFRDTNTYGTMDIAKTVILKALEQEPKWIPVSKRLPEESTAVLVWCPERKNIYCACYEEKQWWIFGAYFQKVELEVIAWMPLPEPYKAESEVKEC